MLNHSPHRFLYLLIALVAFVTIVPVLEAVGYGGTIFTIFVSTILLSAAYAVSESRGQFYLTLILAGPAFALRWINNFLGIPQLEFIADILTALFLLVVAMLILTHVLRDEKVSREKIFAALSVYLLLGVIWAFLFFFVDFLVPGSFRYGQEQVLTEAQMVYYSFVTLTTLGYGDIVPVSPCPRQDLRPGSALRERRSGIAGEVRGRRCRQSRTLEVRPQVRRFGPRTFPRV